MIETLELDNNSFVKETLDNTVFFQLAESGAMGEPGGIIFITDNGLNYHANYCFGDLKWETIRTAFPVIDECIFGMFGHNSAVPKDWVYVNLGMGNHLIVREDFYVKFEPLISNYNRPSEIYQHWLEKAQSLFL
ncbi:MAG: hypothetical protein IK085_03215 [Clostridia bacterium]|nr:hypothetical protein [Clostridia bacterium]